MKAIQHHTPQCSDMGCNDYAEGLGKYGEPLCGAHVGPPVREDDDLWQLEVFFD